MGSGCSTWSDQFQERTRAISTLLMPPCLWIATIVVLAMLLWPQPGSAQDCPVGTGPERQQEMRLVLESLNSPDPTVSIPTFETVVQGCDLTLRRLALHTALQSADPVLQELAVLGVISGLESIVLILDPPEETSGQSRTFFNNSGERLEILIADFDYLTGSFHAQFSGGGADEFDGRGNVAGRRLSLEANARHIYSGANICRLALSGEPGSASLNGALTCANTIDLRASLDLLD